MKARVFLFLVLGISTSVFAQEGEGTLVEVGVLANGAKFIGDSMGGAEVVISDEETGEVLAKGITRGGTGNTGRIMGNEGGIYKSLASEGDAVFTARLPLTEPRKVRIKTSGPLDFPQASATTSETLWLVPGQDFEGDNRVVLKLNGYAIQPVETSINSMGTGRVQVSLRMLCGCPVTPGGMWDADRMIKRATLIGPTGTEQTMDLEYTGEGVDYVAQFSGKVKHPRAVRIEVVGMDNANAGVLVLPVQL